MDANEQKERHIDANSGRTKLLISLAGMMVPVLIILVLELVLRLMGGVDKAAYEDPFVGFEGSPSLFVRDGDHYRTRESRLAWFNDVKFSHAKPSNTFRVFTLGGSTTYGRPYDHRASFSNWLEILLAKGSNQDVEVINAGGVSYASYRVAKIWEEVLEYEPDLLVLYTGHNEFLEERTYQNILKQPEWVRESRGLFSRLVLFRWLRAVFYERDGEPDSNQQKSLMAQEVETRLDRWQGMAAFKRESLQFDATLQHFQTNLRRMMRLAKQADVPVLLITPASNWQDFSPFKSQYSAHLDPATKVRIQRDLEQGKAALRDQRHEDAAIAFERAVASDKGYADSWYYLGQSLLQSEGKTSAAHALLQALETDVCPLRATPAFIDGVREVARLEAIPLIDFAFHLENQAHTHGETWPGDRFFLDHVHPRIAIHQDLGRLLAQQVFQNGWLAGSMPTQAWQQQTFAEVEASFDQAYMAEMEMNLSRVLGWAGKIDEANKALQRSLAVGGTGLMGIFQAGLLAEKQGLFDDAKRAYAQVIEADPSFMQAHLNSGRVLRALGDLDGALYALARARDLDPDEAEIYLTLAGTQLDAGLIDAAQQSLTKLREVAPDQAGYETLQARFLRMNGQLQAAEALLEKQVARFPTSAGSHFDLAVVRGEMGALEKAEAGFKQARDLDPQMIEAWRNLGEVQLARKAFDEAMATFNQALALQPEDSYSHSRLGDVYRFKGQLDEAAEHYTLALKGNPNDRPSLVNLGLIRAQRGELDAGIALLERALELGEGDGSIHYNMAQLLLAAGRQAEARGHLLIAKQRGIPLKPELEAFLGGAP